MTLINSYYPLLDLDTTQKNNISNDRYYMDVSTQGYIGPDDLNIIRRGGAYKVEVVI